MTRLSLWHKMEQHKISHTDKPIFMSLLCVNTELQSVLMYSIHIVMFFIRSRYEYVNLKILINRPKETYNANIRFITDGICKTCLKNILEHPNKFLSKVSYLRLLMLVVLLFMGEGEQIRWVYSLAICKYLKGRWPVFFAYGEMLKEKVYTDLCKRRQFNILEPSKLQADSYQYREMHHHCFPRNTLRPWHSF